MELCVCGCGCEQSVCVGAEVCPLIERECDRGMRGSTTWGRATRPVRLRICVA